MTKLCSKCSIVKSLSEFYNNSASRDGRSTYCAACSRVYSREAYDQKYKYKQIHLNLTEEQRERKRLWDREHYDSEKSKLKNLKFKKQNPEYSKEWYRKNKDSHCARTRARHRTAYTEKYSDKAGSVRYEARLAGYRSGFERSFATNLQMRNIDFEYEATKIPYILECNYHPDFYIKSHDFYIETKGILDSEDRRKHLEVKRQHPELDVRFIFMMADKKMPKSKTTHANWAIKHGFLYAEREIPQAWLGE